MYVRMNAQLDYSALFLRYSHGVEEPELRTTSTHVRRKFFGNFDWPPPTVFAQDKNFVRFAENRIHNLKTISKFTTRSRYIVCGRTSGVIETRV